MLKRGVVRHMRHCNGPQHVRIVCTHECAANNGTAASSSIRLLISSSAMPRAMPMQKHPLLARPTNGSTKLDRNTYALPQPVLSLRLSVATAGVGARKRAARVSWGRNTTQSQQQGGTLHRVN